MILFERKEFLLAVFFVIVFYIYAYSVLFKEEKSIMNRVIWIALSLTFPVLAPAVWVLSYKLKPKNG